VKFDLGPRIDGDHHYALLEYCAKHVTDGVAVEFGVGEGTSAGILTQYMPVIGFDSWLGLPEFWRSGYPTGSFAHQPPIIDGLELVDGWFDDTLPTYDFTDLNIALVHCDADLYSSTKTALEFIGPHMKPGCYMVFDEWFGYPGCEDHEQKAFHEFATKSGVQWRVVGHGHHEAWSIQLV
jgi:hypothetical protein